MDLGKTALIVYTIQCIQSHVPGNSSLHISTRTPSKRCSKLSFATSWALVEIKQHGKEETPYTWISTGPQIDKGSQSLLIICFTSSRQVQVRLAIPSEGSTSWPERPLAFWRGPQRREDWPSAFPRNQTIEYNTIPGTCPNKRVCRSCPSSRRCVL